MVRTIRFLLLAAALLWTLAARPAAADDVAAANRLFVAAVLVWTEAEALQGDDLATAERRVMLLTGVSEALRRIVADHPGADLAAWLVIGERVGPLSVAGA
jgi:hypothetical protein